MCGRRYGHFTMKRTKKIKWPYLRLNTTHALDFWYSNRYCQHLLSYQKAGRWVVRRRSFKTFYKKLRLRNEDCLKSAKLMTADSNFEIRLAGSNIIRNLSKQSCNLKEPFFTIMLLFFDKRKQIGCRQYVYYNYKRRPKVISGNISNVIFKRKKFGNKINI